MNSKTNDINRVTYTNNPDSPVVELRGIYKSFYGVHALQNVDFDVVPGEVHALLGGNGAGKSTLVKLLAGIHQPEIGEIYLRGEQTRFRNPKKAREKGIATIHQNLSLVNTMDVTDNLFLGREIKYKAPWSWLNLINKKEMRRIGASEFERLGINIPSVKANIEMMSGGQRQAIACARALLDDNPSLLIMDEPTAALGVRESAEIIALMKRVSESGTGVLLISHDMEEVFNSADRITVLRLGKKLVTVKKSDVTPSEIVGLITCAIDAEDLNVNKKLGVVL